MRSFELELEQDVAEQIDVSTLTRIVLTHLHFDHAGALTLLPPSVPIVVQRREWEAGGRRGAVKRNFFYPRDYALEAAGSCSSTATTTCSATARSSCC